MQTIQTSVLPATNTKPTRILVKCARGKMFFSVGQSSLSISSAELHREAAQALIARFVKEDVARYGTHRNPWQSAFVTGTLPNGDMCHVFSDHCNNVVIGCADQEDAQRLVAIAKRAQESGQIPALDKGLLGSMLKRSNI